MRELSSCPWVVTFLLVRAQVLGLCGRLYWVPNLGACEYGLRVRCGRPGHRRQTTQTWPRMDAQGLQLVAPRHVASPVVLGRWTPSLELDARAQAGADAEFVGVNAALRS